MRVNCLSLFKLTTLGFCFACFAASGQTKEENALDHYVPMLLKEQRAAGAGVAVIRQGRLVSTHYYGEQSPGAPISADTVFNTASVAKTLTAETMIALAAKGLLDLDAPVASLLRHPDLYKDAHYASLTPRLLLSHRAGLLNWAYEYENGVLAFDHAPDTRFSYSGAGIELAATYAVAKMHKPLQTLAFEYVLKPLNIKEMSMGVIPDWANKQRLATPMNSEGEFTSLADVNPSLVSGDANSAADDLLTTVPAYAKLIEGLIESQWLSPRQRSMRTRILTSLANDRIYACPSLNWLTCPDEYGHSLGWQVFRYGGHQVVMHSGSDAGENALVYFSPDTQNGAVIFINGANGWVIMTRIVELIGDEPHIADYYRALLENVMGIPMPPLVALPTKEQSNKN